MVFLITNLEFITKILNNYSMYGTSYEFLPEAIKSLRSYHINKSNSGIQMASDMISHISYTRKYGNNGMFLTSPVVEATISQLTGQSFDIISDNYLTDKFGVQLKHINVDKTLKSFVTWENELLPKNKLYNHHISISGYNPNLNGFIDILDYDELSYEIISDDITPDEVEATLCGRKELLNKNKLIFDELLKQINDNNKT